MTNVEGRAPKSRFATLSAASAGIRRPAILSGNLFIVRGLTFLRHPAAVASPDPRIARG